MSKLTKRERCSGASRYKALRPPRCGCKACATKWKLAFPLPPAEEARIDVAMAAVRAELIRATKLHGPMRSAHEGYGVIAEEVHELFLEIIGNDGDAAKIEATQVAAMAARFILDV